MISCPICGLASAHPKDAREGYCANCRAWTSASCEMLPDTVREHATREGLCILCLHPPQEHPRTTTIRQATPSEIWERAKP